MTRGIARAYVSIGHKQKAFSALHCALMLCGENRFVLRSAVRCLVHDHDFDAAKDLLKRSRATKLDPWLISADIAANALAGKTSRLIRQARNILKDDGLPPFHTSELAAAIGTLELRSGNEKKARRYFEMALRCATENAIAQAQWAAKHITGFLHSFRADTPFSFEAHALRNLRLEKWKNAIDNCFQWIQDEPFSSRPSIIGSFVANDKLDDFLTAEKLTRDGLQAQPHDPTLLNNLAFSLANQDQVDEARKVIKQISPTNLEESTAICITATSGLIEFRSNDPQQGRRLYGEAIEKASKDEHKELRFRAKVHLCREEIRIGSNLVGRILLELINTAQQQASEKGSKDSLRKLRRTIQQTNAGTVEPELIQKFDNLLREQKRLPSKN